MSYVIRLGEWVKGLSDKRGGGSNYMKVVGWVTEMNFYNLMKSLNES